MSVSIEKIDLLMERAQVGYREARDVLEQFEGNVVEALIYLENNKQTTIYHEQKRNNTSSTTTKPRFMDKIRKGIAKMHATRFILTNEKRNVLDLPLTIAAFFIVIAFPFSLLLLLIAIMTGNKLTVVKPNGSKVKVKDAIEFVETQQQKFSEVLKEEE